MNETNNNNTALQTFRFEDTRIRAGLDDGEPWFVAADVAKVLGYNHTPNMLRTLDDDEKGAHLVNTLGGPQKMTTITEAGLYQIILKREAAYVKDPAARAMVSRFQRWVTHEVLPSLRKTGSYSLPAAKVPESDEELLSRAVLVATNKIQRLETRNRELASENKTLKPKALFADAVGAAENTLTMPQMAKILSSHGFPGGVVKLYRKLREDHVVYRKNGRNLPVQRYVDAGLFTARISPYEAKGHHYNGVTMLVTPKGSRWLAARYCPTAAALPAADTVAPVPTWQNAFFVEEARGYQGEGYPTLHVFDWRAEAEDWAATHDGRPVDRKQGKQEAEDIAGLRVEALGWTWDGTLDALRHLPAFDAPEFVQAVADVYALDAGPWTGNIVFHC